MANTIEVEITAEDSASSTIEKANANLDKMAKELEIVKTGLQQLDFASAFKDASRVDVATAAIDDLKKKLDAGQLTFEQYQQAVQKTSRAFDMVTPESEKLAREITQLNQDFVEGKVDAAQYAQQLDILTKDQDKLAAKTKESSSSMKLMDGVMMSLGNKAVDLVSQIPQMTVELVKFGAEVEQQRISTNALADSFDTSGDAIIDAIQDASQYTISQMGAMQAANKAMVLDVATTPEAFARLAKVATELGKAMGQDATKSIDDFVTAAGRQSKQIADNLGIMVSAESANERYAASINKTADQLTDAEKKQAFLNEMLRQGEAKLGDLGDQSDSASVKMAKLSAALEDAKAGFSEMLVGVVESAGGVDDLASRIRDLPNTVSNVMKMRQAFQDASFAIAKGQNPIDAWNDSLRRQVVLMNKTNPEIERYANAQEDLAESSENVADSVEYLDKSTLDAVESQGDLMHKVLAASNALNQEKLALGLNEDATWSQVEAAKAAAAEQEALAQAALATNAMILDQSMAFTDFFAGVEEAEASHNKTLAELKEEHFANITEIEKRGQATMVQVDAAAEEEKLANLQQRLELALLQQSEFTEKTKASTQLSKENQIAELQEQIATQSQLLDDYYNGRLVNQGENISALLDAENQRYLDEIAIQQEQQAIIEEEQRQSLGRMVLEAFEAWAAMKDIPPDQMLEMRTALAEEYGLVEEGSTDMITNVVASFEEMANGTGKTTAQIVADVANATDAMLALKRGVDNLPTSKTINIDVRVNQRSVNLGGSMMEDMGADMAGGLQQGIENGTPGVVQSVDDMTSDMMGSAAEGMGVNSPSIYMIAMGEDWDEGLIIGIEKKVPQIERTIEKVADTTVKTMSDSLHIATGSQRDYFEEVGSSVISDIIAGIESREGDIDEVLDGLIDVSSSFERAGGTAARILEEEYIAPLTERVESLNDLTETLQDEYEDLGEIVTDNQLEDLNKKLAKAVEEQEKLGETASEQERLDAEQEIADLQQQIADEQSSIMSAAERRLEIENQITEANGQRAEISEEIAAQEQRIAEFKQAQQNLDFLQQQLDLVKMIQETGTDPSVLRDFEFGLDASLESLVDLTTNVLEGVADQVNSEITSIQMEAGRTGDEIVRSGLGINATNVQQRMLEFLNSIFATDATIPAQSTITNNTDTRNANFGDIVLTNNMDMATFMGMMNSFFNQQVV